MDDLLSKYPKKIHTYSFNNPVGASKAREKGVEISTGKYISFLDDDDEWLPEKLFLQVNALINNPEIGAVTCWYYRITKKDIIKVKLANDIKDNDIYWSNFLGSFSFVLVKKEFISLPKMINTNLKSCQDWDFWIKVLTYTSIGIISEYLVKYNDYSQNRITYDQQNKINGLISFFNNNKIEMNANQKLYIEAKINDYKSMDSSIKYLNRLIFKINCLSIYKKLSHPNYTSKRKLIYYIIKFFMPNYIIKFYLIKKLSMRKFII